VIKRKLLEPQIDKKKPPCSSNQGDQSEPSAGNVGTYKAVKTSNGHVTLTVDRSDISVT